MTDTPPKKRGPKKGTGGRPKGPLKITLGTLRVLPHTAEWLKKRRLSAADTLDQIAATAVEITDHSVESNELVGADTQINQVPRCGSPCGNLI